MGTESVNLGFIGAGNMATALIKGLVSSGLYDSEHVNISDVDEGKVRQISDQFGVRGFQDNKALVRQCDIVLLCVKPQNMREVLEDIREEVRGDHLVISIAAGIPLKMIFGVLGREVPAVRVMPNTPALIQRGMSALAPGGLVSSEQMDRARAIFDAVGETVIVEERMMDAVTAISGSGPGYLFRIMECFVEAGTEVGFDEETSLLLVVQTVLGAARLAKESDKSLTQLREMVTSPGGTTAAGLGVFDSRGLEGNIREVVKAARDRGVELGKNY